jgi:hypothetical protein
VATPNERRDRCVCNDTITFSATGVEMEAAVRVGGLPGREERLAGKMVSTGLAVGRGLARGLSAQLLQPN